LTDAVIRRTTSDDTSSIREILEESFSGIYLWHATHTLSKAKDVLCAVAPTGIVGVSILKKLGEFGYVYYVAVKRANRNQGIGTLLLDHAIDFFREQKGIFASVEEDNVASLRLFESKGFERVSFSWLQSRVGLLRTAGLWREMTVVPGEVLLYLELSRQRI